MGIELLYAILVCLGTGVGYSLAFWLLSHEAFDKWKFLRTIIIGLVWGVLMWHFDVDVFHAQVMFTNLGIIVMVDQIVSALQHWWEGRKGSSTKKEEDIK